jgi:hypothetical protein
MTPFRNTAVVLTIVLAAVVIIVISVSKIDLPAAPTNHKLSRMNSLMVIVPYKYEGIWVFDDPAVGLHREPFIAGIDTLIDKAVSNIPDAEHGFRAIFSGSPFPGASFTLQWRRAESDGNWYYSQEFNQEGWLCPALLKYFAAAPREIYVKVEPRAQD